MIEHIERTGEDLGDLKIVTIGGSAAPRAMIKWFRDRGVQVGHAWGMTEMSPIGTIGAPPSNWDALSDEEQMEYIAKQGRSLFNVELRTVDDDGNVLPRDGVTSGRLQARGPWVVKRYFKEERGRDRRRPMVRHRRRRRHPSRRHAADHRPVEGRDQVGRRVDQLDRPGKCRGRLSRRRGSGGDRHPAPQVGRAAAAGLRQGRRAATSARSRSASI